MRQRLQNIGFNKGNLGATRCIQLFRLPDCLWAKIKTYNAGCT